MLDQTFDYMGKSDALRSGFAYSPKRLHVASVQGNSMKIIHRFQSHGAGDINDSLSRGELHSEH